MDMQLHAYSFQGQLAAAKARKWDLIQLVGESNFDFFLC